MKLPRLGKRKLNFVLGLIIKEINIDRLERVLGKFLRSYFTLTTTLMSIEDWDFVIFESIEDWDFVIFERKIKRPGTGVVIKKSFLKTPFLYLNQKCQKQLPIRGYSTSTKPSG